MAGSTVSGLNMPSSADIEAAAVAVDKLKSFVEESSGAYAHLFADGVGGREVIQLPRIALVFLTEALIAMAAGHSVRIVPIHSELTTQEGANLLNVSRPHFVKLLEQGLLPFTKTGRHRRVKLSDVLALKSARDEASLNAMGELTGQAQELGMGY